MTLFGFSQGAQVITAHLITHPDNPKVARVVPTSTTPTTTLNLGVRHDDGGLRHHHNDHEPASTVCSSVDHLRVTARCRGAADVIARPAHLARRSSPDNQARKDPS